jgi:hypothetical protein
MEEREGFFDRLGGALAISVGLGGLAYGILFAYIVEGAPVGVVRAWLVLAILGGLAVTGVFVAIHECLRGRDGAVSRWALLLGVVAGLGQMLNASVALGYELNPPPDGAVPAGPDPLGILRFGLNGVALFLFGLAMARTKRFPNALRYLAESGGVLLVVSYVGRLTGIIDPADRITLLPPLLYGVFVHPIFYVWLGRVLRGRQGEVGASPGPADVTAEG